MKTLEILEISNIKETTTKSRFTWNYVSNLILGRHVRKALRLEASISDRFIASNIHDKPPSSWCNTTLAPPKKEINFKSVNINWWSAYNYWLPNYCLR